MYKSLSVTRGSLNQYISLSFGFSLLIGSIIFLIFGVLINNNDIIKMIIYFLLITLVILGFFIIILVFIRESKYNGPIYKYFYFILFLNIFLLSLIIPLNIIFLNNFLTSRFLFVIELIFSALIILYVNKKPPIVL